MILLSPGALLLLALAGAGTGKSGPAKPSEATLEVYKVHCQSCHMADGDSPLEPMNFVDGVWKHGRKPAQIAAVITNGVPGTAMLPFVAKLSPDEIRALAAYVRSFDKTAGKGKK